MVINCVVTVVAGKRNVSVIVVLNLSVYIIPGTSIMYRVYSVYIPGIIYYWV